MNIYNYIESETIREHLQECKKTLSIMDCAEIICKNLNISIEEKLKAYQELIDTMDDVEIKFEQYKTAKELLKSVITLHAELLEEIDSKKYDCHVTFHYEPYKNNTHTTTYKSKDYKKLVKDELSNEYDGLKYTVLYLEKLQKLKGLINNEGILVEIDHKDVNPLNNFIKQNNLSFTLPFKKGDIIVLKRLKGCSFDPFVLEEIKYSKKGICCKGYSINKDLYSKEYSEDDILNLYYYSDDKTAEYQFLKALSLFVQGKISESELSKIRDFARIKIKQDEMIRKLDFNDNTREILYNLMG